MSRTTTGTSIPTIHAPPAPLDPHAPLMTHLRRNSCRSEQHRLFFVASPKAACTSIKWWFADLEGVRGAVEAASAASAESDPETTIHDLLRRVAPQVADLDPDAIARVLASEEYLRFSVVRHPVPRLFSAWQSKLLLEEPLQAGPYRSLGFLSRPIEQAADLAAGFEEFLEHLAAHEAGAFRDVHWTPQQELLRPDLVRYAIIAKVEEPARLRSLIAARTGREGDDPLGGAFRNRSLVAYSASLVSDRAAALVRELHAADFEAFGYPTKPPRGGRTPTREDCRLLDRAVRMIRGRHRRIAEQHGSLAARDEDLGRRAAELRELRQDAERRHAELVREASRARGELEAAERARGELESLVARTRDDAASRERDSAALLVEARTRLEAEVAERTAVEHSLESARTRERDLESSLVESRGQAEVLADRLRSTEAERDGVLARLDQSESARRSLEGRLAELGDRLSLVESRLLEERATSRSLESRIAEETSRRASLEDRLAAATSRGDRVELERDAERRRVEESEASLAAQRSRGDALEGRLAMAQESAESIATAHAAATARIAALRGELGLLREMLGTRDAEVARLAREGAIRAESLRAVEQLLRTTEESLRAAEQSVGSLEASQVRDRRDLEDLARIRARLESELGRIVASRSWRITRPMRFLGRILRGEWFLVRDGVARAFGRGPAEGSAWASAARSDRGPGAARRLTSTIEAIAYRAARRAYHAWPSPIERKRRVAERLFLRMPRLRRTAQQVALEVVVPTASAPEPPTPVGTDAPRPRALVVEHRIPTPDRTSGSTRLQAIIEGIVERGWEVTVASHARREDYHWILSDIEAELPKYERALESRGVRTIFGPASIAQHLAEQGDSAALVVLSYPEVMHHYAPLVRTSAPSSLLVYDTVDLHGVRFRREAASKGGDADLRRKADLYDAMENANLDAADLSVAITDVEAEEIRRRAPRAPIEIVPNIHAVREGAPGFEARRDLLFIGHYLHAPNEDAMRFFVAEVLPRIERRLPGVRLLMLGSSMTDSVRALARANVEAVGWVEDPTPWFDRCRVFVAPLRFGAGMKGKIGQSMSLGLPVVTTSVGAEGMRLEHGVQAMVADDPDAFADAVVAVHEDPVLWRRLAEGATAHVEANFSARAAGRAIEGILSLAEERRRA